jgi:hypothetical protein
MQEFDDWLRIRHSVRGQVRGRPANVCREDAEMFDTGR